MSHKNKSLETFWNIYFSTLIGVYILMFKKMGN